jgi:hypothetical protein
MISLQGMQARFDPFSFLVVALAGWYEPTSSGNVIHYLMEEKLRAAENRLGIARECVSPMDQRRRLAAKGRSNFGRNLPKRNRNDRNAETLLAWHRKLIAKKYDEAQTEGRDDHRTADEINSLSDANGRGESQLGLSEDSRERCRISGHMLAFKTIGNILKKAWNRARPRAESEARHGKSSDRHWDQSWASDFFTIEVWTPKGVAALYRALLI